MIVRVKSKWACGVVWMHLWMDVSIYVSQVEYVSIYASMHLSMDVSIYLCMCVSMYDSVGKNGVSGSDMDDIM